MKWLTKLKETTKRKAEIRRTETELSRMTDRDLWDIGITRADIRRVARTATK